MSVERVLLAEPRGFCAGVEMAIKALAWMVRVFDPPVYCYHEIVHNRLVVDRFRQLGVVFVDDLDDVPAGAPLMLSAHGSAPEIVAAARERDRFVVNAVCPLVTKVHHEAKVRVGKDLKCNAELTFRQIPFPDPALRVHMDAMANKIGFPMQALKHD